MDATSKEGALAAWAMKRAVRSIRAGLLILLGSPPLGTSL